MTSLATTLCLVMLFLAAAHAWWAVGGIWPAHNAAALAHGVIGDGRDRMPPPWQCQCAPLISVGKSQNPPPIPTTFTPRIPTPG